tara:strand:+ start:338 stop:718 length:381 start_codon:yes stop_codon:yes gene_type:complete
MISFEKEDTNQKLVIAMLVQAINNGKKRLALEQQGLERPEHSPVTRDLLGELEAAALESEMEVQAERASLRMEEEEEEEEEEEPDVRSCFEAWREEVKTELERIRSIPMPGLYELEGRDYANEDPW